MDAFSLVPFRPGVNKDLELLANVLLFGEQWKESPLPSKRNLGYLSDWQFERREKKEIFIRSGTPDAALYCGMYLRAMNPVQTWLNARTPFGGREREAESTTQWSHYQKWGTMQRGRLEPIWMFNASPGFDDPDGVSMDDELTPALSVHRRRALRMIERPFPTSMNVTRRGRRGV